MLARAVRIGFGANITGLAGMVAYSTLMALVPLVALALFVVSLVLEAPGARASLLVDLERIFPTAARDTLQSALRALQGSQITLGLGALASSAWAGIALWSTIDTAFRDIYGYPARTWLEQKRWAARMLAVALALPLALLAVPALHSVAVGGTANLPFGLRSAGSLGLVVSRVVSHALLFGALCAVYRLVPRGRRSWVSTWPGALTALGLVTVVSLIFPLYLARVSSLAHAGALFGFVVVALVWFYALALALLAGATVNAARDQTPTADPVADGGSMRATRGPRRARGGG